MGKFIYTRKRREATEKARKVHETAVRIGMAVLRKRNEK